MALQSQMQRSSNARVQWNPRRRRSRRNKMLLLVVAVVVCYLLWVFFFSGGGTGEGEPQTPTTPTAGDGAVNGATAAGTGNDSISRAGVGPVGSGIGSAAQPSNTNSAATRPSAGNTTTPGTPATPGTLATPGTGAVTPGNNTSATPGNGASQNSTSAQQPKGAAPAASGKTTDTPASTGTTTTNPPDKGAVPTASTTSDPAARQKFIAGLDLQKQQKLIPARKELGEALSGGKLSEADAQAARTALGQINEVLVFSSQLDDTGQDALCKVYLIKPGDNLQNIAKQYKVSAEFLARINQGRIKSISSIRAGQQIKVVNGPFHLKVYKTRQPYRADLYLGDQYVRSFTVGLGKFNSTPVGGFIVKKGSKLVNPEWTDPATGQRMASNDPQNPLGERWIGLRGSDKETEPLTGYGIHGTIEPETVGKEGSRGCIRLLPKDIELLYDMLAEEASMVTILP